MMNFRKTQRVYLDEVEYLVISSSADGDTLLENTVTGERINFKTYNLVTKYLTGKFKTAAQRQETLDIERSQARKPARMDGLSTKAKKETYRRIDYLVRLQHEGTFTKTRARIIEDIGRVAAARGDYRAPDISTIYRWKKQYLEAQKDVRALFARFDAQGGKGTTRLQPEVEAFIDDAVDDIALKQKTFSASELLEAVRLKIDLRNRQTPSEEPLAVPSLRTIQRRAAMLADFDLTAARTSQREAARRFALHGVSRDVSRLLEIVEIDHSPVDLLVVSADRKTAGRPTISVVFERASRCVLGYHLSLAGHRVTEVFQALRHALLPKTYLQDRYADLGIKWEPFGWFERLLMDNGREFHADAVADAMMNLGIACEFAASRTPNDKPFVERFMRTFNYGLVHKLKGTTLSKAHKRVGFNPEDEAVLTLEELDRIIHVWICNKYHLKAHRGLGGRAPISVWRELAKANPPQLKMNAADIDIEFSEITSSKVQSYGIDLNTFVYRSQQLLLLRRVLPANAVVHVKWPRNDVGYIWVWDSVGDRYIKVPNTEPEYAGLTLDQAKAARKAKADGDPSYVQTQAEAGAIIRGMVADADRSTKLAQRRQGGRLAHRTSRQSRDGEPAVKAEKGLSQATEDPQQVAYLPLEDFAIELPLAVEEV